MIWVTEKCKNWSQHTRQMLKVGKLCQWDSYCKFFCQKIGTCGQCSAIVKCVNVVMTEILLRYSTPLGIAIYDSRTFYKIDHTSMKNNKSFGKILVCSISSHSDKLVSTNHTLWPVWLPDCSNLLFAMPQKGKNIVFIYIQVDCCC